MPSPNEQAECKCGGLARMAEDPKDPIEFDARLNEYHIIHKGNGGYSLVYYCPLCGGRAPASKRSSLFQRLDDFERRRLSELTKDLRTVQEVVAAFGQPDVRRPVGMTIIRPEIEGVPETAQSFPAMTYSRLSETANVYVSVYPDDKVSVSFQPKPMLVKQTHEFHAPPSPAPPEPEPQIDTSRRYDIYCVEPSQGLVVYRNSRFKGAGSLLPSPGMRGGFSQFLELEQSNDQSVFISRGSVVRFCEPGTEPLAEPIPHKPKPTDTSQ
jgi:hypothetical protein